MAETRIARTRIRIGKTRISHNDPLAFETEEPPRRGAVFVPFRLSGWVRFAGIFLFLVADPLIRVCMVGLRGGGDCGLAALHSASAGGLSRSSRSGLAHTRPLIPLGKLRGLTEPFIVE
jgi:hypothetical protein